MIKKNENGIKEPIPTRKTKTESAILQLASVLKSEPTITFKDLEYTQLKQIKKK